MPYQYPLSLSFKIVALAPQVYVADATGREVMYVKMKMFKLKEDINVFSDRSQTNLLYNIKADRIIDFSANYRFSDANGNALGSIKREGMRSIFKASYLLMDETGNQVGRIGEDNGWIRVADMALSELPVIGMFTGYFFNPTYTLYRGETPALKLAKQPAFFEGKFLITKAAEPMNDADEIRMLLSYLMMVLLERSRG